jgi:hypothetical protein
MWGQAVDGLPWGWGNFGATRTHLGQHPWSAFYSASSAWNFHAHNDFLDTLINGGFPLLAMLLAQCLVVAYHVTRIADRTLQLTCMAFAAALLVLMNLSVVYGTVVGIAAWHLAIGLILRCPASSTLLPQFRLPQIRYILLPLASITAIAGAYQTQATFMHRDASIGVKYAALSKLLTPMTMFDLHKSLEHQLVNEGQLVIGDQIVPRREVLDRMNRVFGPIGPVPRLEVVETVDQYVQALAGTDQGALDRARRDFECSISRYLRLFPFDRFIYTKLRQALLNDPPLEPLVPPRLAVRASYLSGDPTLPAPDLAARPRHVEALADFQAHIVWGIANGRPWDEISPALEHLVTLVGHVHVVSALALKAAAHSGVEPHFSWTLRRVNILRRTLNAAPTLETLQDITSPWRARGIMPLLRALFPGLFADLAAGRPALGLQRPPSFQNEYEVLRIYRLSQLEIDQPADAASDPSAPGSPPPGTPAAPATGDPASTPAPGP